MSYITGPEGSTLLMDMVVFTDYGQFDLWWDDDGRDVGDLELRFAGQVNGVVGAAIPTGMYLNFARRSGGSRLRMFCAESQPPDDGAEWEDVVEVSVRLPAGTWARWATWGDEAYGSLALDEGDYRVRVRARGRDAAHDDEFAEDVTDEYEAIFWPDEWRPDEILRCGSENAAYWHRELGSRRAEGEVVSPPAWEGPARPNDNEILIATAQETFVEPLMVGGARFPIGTAMRGDLPAIVMLLADDVLGSSREHVEDLAAYEAAFAQIDGDPRQLLVVVRNDTGSLVGTMQLSLIPGLSRGGATRLQIEGVRTAESVRGRGVGAAMFAWAHEYGLRQGASLAQLTTDKQRPDAHRFYERLGYVASHVGYKLPL